MRQSAGVLLLLAIFVAASTADASFPGRNGLIAFQRDSRPCKIRAGDDGRDLHCPASIWTANLDGSNERRLTTGADSYRPAWSPDGKKLAYVRFVGYQAKLEIWIMNADGSGKRRLHRIEAPLGHTVGSAGEIVPRWSADGKSILIGGWKVLDPKPPIKSKGAVIAVPANGTAPQILFLIHGPRISNPQPSPSGKLIAFIGAGAHSWQSVLYVARPDGSHNRALSSVAAGNAGYDWSPDGRRIVFWRRVNENGSLVPHLHVVNADGSGLHRITSYPTSVETYDEAPSWSPDGTTIVFKSGTPFGENGLPDLDDGKTFEHRFATIDRDGGNLHLVGPEEKDCGVGSWHETCYTVAPVWQPRPR